MLTAIEDRAFVTALEDADEVATSIGQESLADEAPRDPLRILRRQDIADHGVLFR